MFFLLGNLRNSSVYPVIINQAIIHELWLCPVKQSLVLRDQVVAYWICAASPRLRLRAYCNVIPAARSTV